MKILGISTGHDCSYCLLEDGIPVIHEKWERNSRIKESGLFVRSIVRI